MGLFKRNSEKTTAAEEATEPTEPATCWRCNGAGQIAVSTTGRDGCRVNHAVKCPNC